MTLDQLADNGEVSVKFNSTTGHPILLAQQNRLPTLKDFQLKFSNSTLGATPSGIYRINGASVSSGRLILGVFNVDYAHRGVSEFSIAIIGEYLLLNHEDSSHKSWITYGSGLLVYLYNTLHILFLLMLEARL